MNPRPNRILLVEDDDAHITLIDRTFQRSAPPTHLFVARTLREARRRISQTPPDLIITDLILPDGRGVSFPIDEFSKTCLLEGIDQLGYLLKHKTGVVAYEESHTPRVNTAIT